MTPSRFQTQQGPYGPLLTAGLYPMPQAAPAASPTAPVSGGGVSATPMTPAPSAAPPASSAAATPRLSVGSQMQGDGGDNESAPSTPSPDQSLSGLAGALGAAGSIAFGGPLGGLGMMGALGINSAMGVPSFSMQTALDDLAQTAFGRTADVTAGVMGAPAGTGAAVSSWGLADAPEGGKGGSADGGQKGEEGGKPGASTDTGPPGEAKGEATSTDTDVSIDGGTSSDGPAGNDAGGNFAVGGYTGHGDDGVVQRDQPAGTVHEGEIVIPAPMVKHYGLDLLMGLVNGNVPKNRLAELARGAD